MLKLAILVLLLKNLGTFRGTVLLCGGEVLLKGSLGGFPVGLGKSQRFWIMASAWST